MSIPTKLGALLLGTCGIAAAQAPPMQAPEEAIEAYTRDIALPEAADGSLLARTCPTCPQVLLRLDARSKFYVGRSQVDFATLSRYWSESERRPLAIIYDRKALTVARLVVDGQLP